MKTQLFLAVIVLSSVATNFGSEQFNKKGLWKKLSEAHYATERQINEALKTQKKSTKDLLTEEFYKACVQGDCLTLGLLLKYQNVDINQYIKVGYSSHTRNGIAKKMTPLYLACRAGKLDAVAMLLDRKEVDVNKGLQEVYGDGTIKKVETPLDIAISKKHHAVRKELIRRRHLEIIL